MSTDFWWIFDALAVILAVYVIYSNAKRGLTKVWVLAIGYLVAMLGGFTISEPFAEVLYDGVAYESDLDGIDRVNKHVNFPDIFARVIDGEHLGIYTEQHVVKEYINGKDADQFADKLYEYMNRRNDGVVVMPKGEFERKLCESLRERYGALLGKELPEYVRVNFEEKLDVPLMIELIRNYAMGNVKASDYVEETYVKEPTIRMLQIFSFFIIFSVIMVFAAIFSALLENKVFFNNTYTMERVYGGLIGVMEAAVMVWMMALLVKVLVMLGGGDLLCFNEPTIAATKLFHYVYDQLGMLH